jgi:hypothetical protein
MQDKMNLYSIESRICTITYHIVDILQKSENKIKRKEENLEYTYLS